MASLACTDLNSTRWMLNKNNQNPCQVAQRVLQVCSPSASLPFLDLDFQCPLLTNPSNTTTTANTTSSSPTSATTTALSTSLDPPASSCCCSSITFSLLSACWACQWNQPLSGRVTTKFSTYQAQCAPNRVLLSSFDQSVKLRFDNASIIIPPWAAIAPDEDALWNQYNAEVNATLPPTASSTELPTTSSSSFVSRLPLSGGAIAGITLAALVFVAALLTACCFWWRRRRMTVRSVNLKSPSPISPRSPWRNLGRADTVKSEGGGKLDLDLTSGVSELLSPNLNNNGRRNPGSGGRRGFGSMLANVRRITPPRRPLNPQSSNLNFHLVESNSTSTHTHTNTQSQSHAHAQLGHPHPYPLPQHTPALSTDVPPTQDVQTQVQPQTPTPRDKGNRTSQAPSVLQRIKSTVQRFTPTSPRGPYMSPTSALSPQAQQVHAQQQPQPQPQQQPRPVIDLLSPDPTLNDANANTNTDTYTYMAESNRMGGRPRRPLPRFPAVDPNRPPSPRMDSEPMGASTVEDLEWMGGVSTSAPLSEDVLRGAWVGEGGVLFVDRESVERRERERQQWRDEEPILVPSEDVSVDEDDAEDSVLREVLERTRIEAEEKGAARPGYVPAQTRPLPQASGSGLYPAHVQPAVVQQPRPRPQPPQRQQQHSTSQSLAPPVGALRLPEIQFSPSPLLTPRMMAGSAFPSTTSLLNLPPPPPHPPPRPPQVASTSTSRQVTPQLPQPTPRPLPQAQQPEPTPIVIPTTTAAIGPQDDLPDITIPIPPLEPVSTGSPISPSLLAPSGLSPTSLEWISPPDSFIEHPDVPVPIYTSGNGGGRKRASKSKGGVWQVTSPIDAPASSRQFGAATRGTREGLTTVTGADSPATGLKRTASHPPRTSKPHGARANEALPSSVTKRMFAKAGVVLGPGGSGSSASTGGRQPQPWHMRSMSADSAVETGIGSGGVVGSSGNLHLPFVLPGSPPPVVVSGTPASNVRTTVPQPSTSAPTRTPAPTVRFVAGQQQPSVSAPTLISRHPLPPPPLGMPPRPVVSPAPSSSHSQLSPQAPLSPPTRGPRPRPTSPPQDLQQTPQASQVRESRFSMLSLLQPPSRDSRMQSQSQTQSQTNTPQVLSPTPEEEGRFMSRVGYPDAARSAPYGVPTTAIDSTDSLHSAGTGRSVRRLPPIPGGGQPPP